MRIKKRIKKIFGTKNRPRLAVYRSNKHIYAQIIDDSARKTLAAANSLQSKVKSKKQTAAIVGKIVAKDAIKKKIKKVVFDRREYKYHGRIKKLADSARKEGLRF